MSSVSSVSSVPSVSSVADDSVATISGDEDRRVRMHRRRRRRARVFRERNNPFDYYDDDEFKARFRLSKESVQFVLSLIEHDIKPTTSRNKSISAMNQLLITLRFYACGSFQINVGDHFSVTKATVSRIVHKTTHAIAALSRRFIKMPDTEQEKAVICREFYNIARFPNVIGVIDGSHIRIQSPGGDNAETFRNRKGYFSLNIQVISDAHLKIMDVVARWPGSAHDSNVFDSSLIKAKFENNEFGHTYLLGDSGYACRRYLLTPLLNPITNAQQRYNSSHIRTRNVIERTFGVLKRRFPCLSLGLRVSPRKAIPIIVATCVLHNICGNEDDIGNLDYVGDDEDNDDVQNIAVNVNNNFAVRNAVVNTVFQ